eukprot:CAMPEP_0119111628 /NCGR_PEP_ID=MMETSP1180-20130426/36503_1 /TAXON_ID=3052 ORGANISM="Chlamydomonas cf sp, Strain CCMP681" /NCGR_SAMPLE_ID=MMETSP1180 /ASSEMBLY_ACC=CAM_ASM_000741 /LENGTH=479 /DNA_ID=CAMNT_0007098693 /DNA_START=95 /DNA_END=1534 /DNA_ORIENTATION=+
MPTDSHVDKKQRTSSTTASKSASQEEADVDGQRDVQFKVPGAIVTSRTFTVPLDHSGTVEGNIQIFVRHLVAPVQLGKKQPFLLYFSGGPGFESPRVTDANSGWIKKALDNFQVLLMDGRGTGRSTPITTNNLRFRGDAAQQAQYLSFFRADSIVHDAEVVRQHMVPGDNYKGRLSILGQSFGGFCCFTYLSMYPGSLIEVFTTGGVPPDVRQPCVADAVYRGLAPRVHELNRRYYKRYPGDAPLVRNIIKWLAAQPGGGRVLPDGTLLTPRLFQTLGLSGLGSGGGFDRLHYLLETFFDEGDEINPTFIKAWNSWQHWDTNPLYALLHESIYTQGEATNWAAHRTRQDPQFTELFDAVKAVESGHEVLFTGEAVFPWMFDDVACLRPYKAAAELLAAKSDWGPLYNPDVLAAGKIPVASATYLEDMYVDYNLAQDTARTTGEIRQWVTNEYKHSGIRDDGYRIFERLLSLVRDSTLLE